MSLVLGVTGGIGCGKSTFLSHMQKKYDAKIIEADSVGRTLMQPDTQVFYQIVNEFSADILNDGMIDRNKLASIVFNDKTKLSKLNSIVHPAVMEYIKSYIKKESANASKLIIIESAILVEAGYKPICDLICYIYADEDTRIKRLMDNRGYTKEKAMYIMNNQKKHEQYLNECDIMIDNSKDLANLENETLQKLDVFIK